MPVAIMFYDVVLAAHIASILIAFGAVFAYPIGYGWLRRSHPGQLPVWHGLQAMIGKRVVSPAATLALIAGAYLATDRDYWSEVWVTVPLLILIVVMGLFGAYFGPTEERLSKADTTTAEYTATASRLVQLQMLAAGLVLVAVFFMTAKPGA